MKLNRLILTVVLIFGSCVSFATPQQISEEGASRLDQLFAKNKGKKAVYLDFWASWCGPCKISIPWLNRMQEEHSDEGFMVIGINLDKSPAKLKRFLKEIPINFELIEDPEGLIAGRYELGGMPSSFLFDKKGDVKFKHIGFRINELEKYEKEIQQLIQN